jgi:hypothetical protein
MLSRESEKLYHGFLYVEEENVASSTFFYNFAENVKGYYYEKVTIRSGGSFACSLWRAKGCDGAHAHHSRHYRPVPL